MRHTSPTAGRTGASSPSSPMPRPSSGFSWLSARPPSRRGSARPADRPPGRVLPSRCRTGTSSASPRPTSSLTSALPGNRRLPAARDGAAALVYRPLAAPQMLAPATRNARACTARGVRQPRRCVLTAHPVGASRRRIPSALASRLGPTWPLRAGWISYPSKLRGPVIASEAKQSPSTADQLRGDYSLRSPLRGRPKGVLRSQARWCRVAALLAMTNGSICVSGWWRKMTVYSQSSLPACSDCVSTKQCVTRLAFARKQGGSC
jgi:hypothetical protein